MNINTKEYKKINKIVISSLVFIISVFSLRCGNNLNQKKIALTPALLSVGVVCCAGIIIQCLCQNNSRVKGFKIGTQNVTDIQRDLSLLDKTIKCLKEENKNLKQALKLERDKLLQNVLPSDEKSNFPNIEDIVNEFSSLYRQNYTNLFDELTDLMKKESDSKDDEEDNILRIERRVSGILYEALIKAYHSVKYTKANKIEEACKLIMNCINLQDSNKNKKKFKKAISSFLLPYLQENYDTFTFSKVAGNIFNSLKIKYELNTLKSKENQNTEELFLEYIKKCCEVCWKMVLNKPKLYLYPNTNTLNSGIDIKNFVIVSKKNGFVLDISDELIKGPKLKLMDMCICTNTEYNHKKNNDGPYNKWPSIIRAPLFENENHLPLSKGILVTTRQKTISIIATIAVQDEVLLS